MYLVYTYNSFVFNLFLTFLLILTFIYVCMCLYVCVSRGGGLQVAVHVRKDFLGMLKS